MCNSQPMARVWMENNFAAAQASSINLVEPAARRFVPLLPYTAPRLPLAYGIDSIPRSYPSSSTRNCSCHTLHTLTKYRELVSHRRHDPADSIDPILQIGWFHVFKGYIPNKWTSQQEFFLSQSMPMHSHTL